MRLKLLRRRLSISAPRMIVRSHLLWPLRWAVIALMFGFSAALAPWAFEFGRNIAGLDRNSTEELQGLRVEVAQLRGEREKALLIANTAESLLKTGKTVQDKLAQQLRQVEADNLAMRHPRDQRESPRDRQGLGRSRDHQRHGQRPIRSTELLELQPKAVIVGDVRYEVLEMHQGATIDGELRPMSAAEKPGLKLAASNPG